MLFCSNTVKHGELGNEGGSDVLSLVKIIIKGKNHTNTKKNIVYWVYREMAFSKPAS